MALVDVRQLVAGMLTLSMFIMLGNMIRKDHFGTAIVSSVLVYVYLILLELPLLDEISDQDILLLFLKTSLNGLHKYLYLISTQFIPLLADHHTHDKFVYYICFCLSIFLLLSEFWN